jgi:hypothetical protein
MVYSKYNQKHLSELDFRDKVSAYCPAYSNEMNSNNYLISNSYPLLFNILK